MIKVQPQIASSAGTSPLLHCPLLLTVYQRHSRKASYLWRFKYTSPCPLLQVLRQNSGAQLGK